MVNVLGVEGENIREVDVDKIVRVWVKHYDAGVRAQITYPVMPAYRMLDETAQRIPYNSCAFFYGNYVTFKQIKEASEKVCGFLQSIGFEKGDKALVSLPNTPHYTSIAYGIMKAGGTVVQCNPLYTTREIKFLVENSESEIAFCIDLIYPNIQPILDEGLLKKVVLCSFQDFISGASAPDLPEKREELIKYEDVMKFERSKKFPEINPREDVAMLQYTGGTTGS
ncbi:MAG: AMP-binding protein, partial [Archaeoglobaceae archaeon]